MGLLNSSFTALRSAASQVLELLLAAVVFLGADLELEAVVIHLQAWARALGFRVAKGEAPPTRL